MNELAVSVTLYLGRGHPCLRMVKPLSRYRGIRRQDAYAPLTGQSSHLLFQCHQPQRFEHPLAKLPEFPAQRICIAKADGN